MRERFEKIAKDWFLMEPFLFQIYCGMSITPNEGMHCAVRSGKGKIEYQPALMSKMDDYNLELLMRSELIRLALKHPYERQPENCSADVVTMASNFVLTEHYPALTSLGLQCADEYGLPKGEAFEWYAHQLSSQENNSSDNKKGDDDESNESIGNDSQNSAKQSLAEQSELWEEDQLQQQKMNDLIQSTTHWGSIPEQLREMIEASSRPKIDFRRAFAGFRSSVISSNRHLTRMRPNRRMEFEQMGSVYQLATRLLVAVDVSGSVSSEQLSHFYSLILRFFKYGIEEIDTVQFDTVLGEVKPIKQKTTKIEVLGRGGTSFQPAIDYAKEHNYDGLCILTDGYAPAPTIPTGFRTPLLWVLGDEKQYRIGSRWMEALPHSRACWIKL